MTLPTREQLRRFLLRIIGIGLVREAGLVCEQPDLVKWQRCMSPGGGLVPFCFPRAGPGGVPGQGTSAVRARRKAGAQS